MFERFTERARQVVVFAQDEARGLKHNYIGTEHILLGLMREQEGLGARVIESLGVSIEDVRAQVARIVGQGDEVTQGQIPFTPRAKKVLELSLREALSLGHNYIGTEHVLLGLARENEGVAARILLDFGVDAEKVRNAVIDALSGTMYDGPPFVPESPPVAPEVVAELERVRSDKERALEAQEFQRAATLRDRERRLTQGARLLTRAWKGEPDPDPPMVPRAAPAPGVPRIGQRRLRREHRPRSWQTEAVIAGWAMFGVAAALGVLLGWLIWG
jgi:ATP-dependent Clp protease ATP-binding subunit ClpA